MQIDFALHPQSLRSSLDETWLRSGEKIRLLRRRFGPEEGSPVFTVEGRYTSRAWTEWTQGFQYGGEILHFDATGDEEMLRWGRMDTVKRMDAHITHFGVHDHGFNNVSTFGNLRRLMLERRIAEDPWERRYYELALKASASVQAWRWTHTRDGGGFVYSFNGPHSLFADTMRTLRVLAMGHLLGHRMLAERDEEVSLLGRLIRHAHATASFAVFYGEGRDVYDVRGRTAHESIFNTNDGSYRCPGTQQGYSPFSTWTRGLAWVMLGMAEELEFLWSLSDEALQPFGGRAQVEEPLLRAAHATCDFYIQHTPDDGIPYWDTGAPGLAALQNRSDVADPFNPYEPVDSSAAAIAAQGLLRLSRYMRNRGLGDAGSYWHAGLTVARSLMADPYLSSDTEHEGLLLHSVYHRPNGWDHVPEGRSVPSGESSMWGDYHLRELALYVQRIMDGGAYYTFFGPVAEE